MNKRKRSKIGKFMRSDEYDDRIILLSITGDYYKHLVFSKYSNNKIRIDGIYIYGRIITDTYYERRKKTRRIL